MYESRQKLHQGPNVPDEEISFVFLRLANHRDATEEATSSCQIPVRQRYSSVVSHLHPPPALSQSLPQKLSPRLDIEKLSFLEQK